MKLKIDIKEEVTHDVENIRKKNETNTKHNGRSLQQTSTSIRQNLRT
jgi:hypothetical protein